MTAFTRCLSISFLIAGAAWAGPSDPPKKVVHTGPVVALAVKPTLVDRWREMWTPFTNPYLAVTPPKPFRTTGEAHPRRNPPLLPQIVVTEPKPPAGQGAPEGAAAPVAPALPEADPNAAPPVPPLLKPEDEAVQFFQRPENRPSSEKDLGPTFDATFDQAPAPSPSTSHATYKVE
jgi:hypothetical protein